jgi:hypothetical protein
VPGCGADDDDSSDGAPRSHGGSYCEDEEVRSRPVLSAGDGKLHLPAESTTPVSPSASSPGRGSRRASARNSPRKYDDNWVQKGSGSGRYSDCQKVLDKAQSVGSIGNTQEPNSLFAVHLFVTAIADGEIMPDTVSKQATSQNTTDANFFY